ncbi:MAG TPA: hypothetical protein VMD97_09755 [Candidatus Aquilonibacter sp.]|nr:hypothetical protein [Candidatus Aquilonibacter sp.]
MPVTEEFRITLPAEAASYVHKRIADGNFSDATEYFESLVVADLLAPPPSADELTQWMNTEGARRLEALHRNPSSGLTSDQAFAGLTDESEDEE